MAAYQVDPQRDALAASSDLRRRLFGRRRHAGLPLPIDSAIARYHRQNSPAVATVQATTILEDIVRCTLSNLHNIQKSLLYWKSRAKASNPQRLYFILFERGPRSFLQTTWQTLGSKTPSQNLLSSAASIISTRLHALMSMQHCLAAFLTEVYSEADKFITQGSSDQSPLRALLVALNMVFLKLERSLAEVRTEGSTTTLPIFQRLPEADDDVENSTATSLIIQNLLGLDAYISEKIAVHQKPRNTTIYWLPYTCGAIGLSACSLWLLRHSSLMGTSSSDTDGSAAGYCWDQRAMKLIVSIRDGLYKAFKPTNQQLESTKQDVVRQIDASSHRSQKDFRHLLPQRPPGPGRELALATPTTGKNIQHDLCAAWPAFGLCALLLLVLRASVFHDDEAARLPQRLLLHHAELRLVEFYKCMAKGMEEKASAKFGLMLCELDRLYRAVEFHASKSGEWSMVREDIAELARPHMPTADRVVVIARLKQMYYCLLPSPSPYGTYPPFS